MCASRLTVVINHVFDVSHDFSIAAVSLLGHLCDARFIVEDSRRLRIENKRHG